jgi:hypothetical protein
MPLTFSLASAASVVKESVGLHLYVVDTGAPVETFTNSILAALKWVQESNCGVHRAGMIPVPDSVKTEKFYGYAETEYGLKYMVQNNVGCSYYLFTNGDNIYSRYLFQEIAEPMGNGTDIICWDFVSHHLRNGVPNTMIRSEFKRKHIDLGSCIISHNFIRDTGAEFLPQGIHTTDLYARDWYFIDNLMKHNASKIIIPQILFMHL